MLHRHLVLPAAFLVLAHLQARTLEVLRGSWRGARWASTTPRDDRPVSGQAPRQGVGGDPPVLPSCTSFINPNETGLPSRRTASLGYTLAILGWVGLRRRDPRSRPRGGRRHHRAPLHHPAPPPNPRPRRAPVRAWHVGDDGTPVGRRHGASRKRAVALGCRERFSRCFSQSASFSRPDFVRATARGVRTCADKRPVLLIHATLDKQYRALLEQPVPTLSLSTVQRLTVRGRSQPIEISRFP